VVLAAVLLQPFLPASMAEGPMRNPLKKRPVDLNSCVAIFGGANSPGGSGEKVTSWC
jgi:hypothetical protein